MVLAVAPPPTGRSPGRPKGRSYSSSADLTRYARLHAQQAKLHEIRQKLVYAIATVPIGEEPDPALITQLQRIELMSDASGKIDAFLSRCSAAMLTIQDAAQVERESMSDEQLAAQLSAEFIASIRTWGQRQWDIVEAFQAKYRSKT